MIYVASSWRNDYQPSVVTALRDDGFAVYDFRNPTYPAGLVPRPRGGFHWSDIDAQWERWDLKAYTRGLDHQLAVEGFRSDAEALQACTACVLVLPSGRSAHLEGGYVVGLGRPLFVYIPDVIRVEPELMYKLAAGGIHGDLGELRQAVARYIPKERTFGTTTHPQPGGAP